MADIEFVKTGATTVTLTQAEDLDSTQPKKPRQRIGRSDSGLYKVVKLSTSDQEFRLKFGEMPQVDHDAILAFLEDPLIDWSLHPFTYTDSTGTDHQVRFLDGNFPAPEIAPGIYAVEFTLAIDRGSLSA